MSSKTASSCARTNSGGSSWIAVTPTVFCAVSATSTDIPCAPAAANAFRSAWIPAPPPESEVAIVSARGTVIAPFAGTNRIRFRRSDHEAGDCLEAKEFLRFREEHSRIRSNDAKASWCLLWCLRLEAAALSHSLRRNDPEQVQRVRATKRTLSP